ncbi:MAG: STT3 domain-containing protein [Candidatus Kariarchaeaceae archaeon]|jgi:dolichyl-diphosphooligosaccharide--protein glycosyltransferase
MSQNTIDVNEWLGERWENLKRRVRGHFEEYDFSRRAIAHNVSLMMILIVALTIRLFPLMKGWDPTIKAFDPWMQVRAAEYIIDNGFTSYLLWFDEVTWYPYGRAMGASLYPAVPLAIVFVYQVLTFLGFDVTVETAAYFVPVIFGTLGVYYTYLLGKELISARGGLIAALIMAVIPAYVSRSIAGFVDNESVGVLFTVMTFYYFIRSLSRDSHRSAVMAGISMALLGSSWGAFRFAYDLLPVYALVIVITGNYSMRFLRTYATTVSVSTMIMLFIPRVGGTFLFDMEGLAPLGMLVFLVVFGLFQDLSKNLTSVEFRRIILFGFFVIFSVLAGLFTLLIFLGGVNIIGDKFISVILPNSRNSLPLIDSVSEHLPLAWGNLYFNLSTLVFFIPMGVFFAIKKPTEKNLFILTFTLLTIYFSGSMVRLMLILAPAAAISTALAVDNLLIPYAYAAHGRIKLTKTTMALPSIGGENAAGSYIVVFVLLSIMVSHGINTAGDVFTTPELTPGTNPTNALNDWLEAFDWMRTNTNYKPYIDEGGYTGLEDSGPPVMLSWWDYGYYITSQGETASLVDNATINSTQIATVGTMLMWNATASINLMHMYNVKYVLVVPAAGQLNLGSDIGKSIWMIRISEQYTPQFGVVEEDYFQSGTGYVDKWYDSVLYKLMAYEDPHMEGVTDGGSPPFIDDRGFQSIAPEIRSHNVYADDEAMQYFTEVFRSTGMVESVPGDYPLVRIFQVDYPDDIDLRVNDFKEKMAQA